MALSRDTQFPPFPPTREERIKSALTSLNDLGVLSLEEVACIVTDILQRSGLTMSDGAMEVFAAMAAKEGQKIPA